MKNLLKTLFITAFIFCFIPFFKDNNVYANSGGYALRFYGTGATPPYNGDYVDRIVIPVDNPQTYADIGSSDFTIEWWMKANLADNPSGACSDWICGNIIVDRDIWTFAPRKFGISMYNGFIRFGSGDPIITIQGDINVADNLWHHVAVTRRVSDGQQCIFIDGTLDICGDTADGDISYPDGLYQTGSDAPWNPFLVIGAEKHDAGTAYPSYNGYIDEFRISFIARYTSNFTRPTNVFQIEPDTLILYHFDEGSGTTVQDATSSNVDGTIRYGGNPAGPVYVTSDAPFGSEMWMDTGYGNWDANNSPLLVSGDFDGDGDDDIATLYKYNNNRIGLWVFKSDGFSGFTRELWYDSGVGNWDSTRSPQLSSGDFDNDGDDDIATMYRYNNNRMGIWVFKSNGSNSFTSQIWYDSGNGNWDATRSPQLTAGDFDNDSDSDIATMYRYDNNRMGVWVFKSNGTNNFTSQSWYDSGNGNWDATRSPLLTSNNFDSDSDDDIGVLYKYNNLRIGLWVFKSNGSNSFTSQMWYDSGEGNWDWNRSPQITSGDFDNDGDGDISLMYRYNNNRMGIWHFRSNGSNSFSGVLNYDSGDNSWDANRSVQITAGNYNAAGGDEIATMYRYDNNRMAIWIFR